MTTFADLGLSSAALSAVKRMGYEQPTPVQEKAIPLVLKGRDMVAAAQTGTGKTAAFALPAMDKLEHAKGGSGPLMLIVTPTRELAQQIGEVAGQIAVSTHHRITTVVGGLSYKPQIDRLSRGTDILIATPGRLIDLMDQKAVRLSDVKVLVLDEADRMLDMGFIPDVRRIMSYLPPKDKRTTMLYSATLNDAVMRLAMNWMEEPYKAEVESQTNATDTVRQVVYIVRAADKFKVLYNHIALHSGDRTIVFCNRKSTTEDVYESLKVRGVSVEMLSGDVNQNKRLKVLDAFRDGEVKVVVATDVAGRGIDIKGLEYVINFDFPYEAEDYVHRIGRTGRAGSTGIAISFADENESFAIPDIEAYIKEPLKCTMIGGDDPLLKDIPPRGSRLGEVNMEAKAEVDAREAVGDEEKAAAAAMTGALANPNATTASGAPAVLKDNHPDRPLPKFEHALDPKAPPPDESDIYSKPVEQKTRTEEWNVTEK